MAEGSSVTSVNQEENTSGSSATGNPVDRVTHPPVVTVAADARADDLAPSDEPPAYNPAWQQPPEVTHLPQVQRHVTNCLVSGDYYFYYHSYSTVVL